MDKLLICCICLARDDLLRITEEKERLINSVLQKEISKDNISRICINCSTTLLCRDKFQKMSRVAQKIMKEQNASLLIQNNLIDTPSAIQDKLSDAFDIISNWLTSVNVVLEHQSISSNLEVSKDIDLHNGSLDPVPGEEFVSEESSKGNSKDQNAENGSILCSNELEEPIIGMDDEHNEVHDIEPVPGKIFPDNSKDDKTEDDHANDSKSSSDESEEPIIEMDDTEVNEIRAKLHTEKTIQELDDDIDKYRDSTRKNTNRNYKCPECKNFFCRHELKYHYNIHKGIKPFKCFVEGCSKAYGSPYAAKYHCNQIHKLNVSASKWIKFDKRWSSIEMTNDKLESYKTNILRYGRPTFECPECKILLTKFQLKYHMNAHKGIKPFKCFVEGCSKDFISPYVAVQHCKVQHNLNVKTSKFTGCIEDDFKAYKTNIIRNKKPLFKCPKCRKLFDRNRLKYHMNTHKGLKPFKCFVQECSQVFSSPYLAKTHCIRVHKLNVKAAKFTKIDHSIESEEPMVEMNDERDEVHDIESVSGKNYCPINSKDDKNEDDHANDSKSSSDESEEPTIEMDDNENNEQKIQELDDDVDKYRDNTLKYTNRCYKCPQCKKFFCRQELKYHFNVHKGLTPFKCFVKGCSKAYSSPYLAKNHCNFIHKLNVNASKWIKFEKSWNSIEMTDESLETYKTNILTKRGKRTFECPECKKLFCKIRLKYHMNSHSGKRPYKCFVEGCCQDFISPIVAQQHCRRIHKLNVSTTKWTGYIEDDFEAYKTNIIKNGSRLFKCPECKNMYRRYSLKYHMNSHKGIKPFKCFVQECSAAFSSPSLATKHCRQVHKLNVSAGKFTKIDQKEDRN